MKSDMNKVKIDILWNKLISLNTKRIQNRKFNSTFRGLNSN